MEITINLVSLLASLMTIGTIVFVALHIKTNPVEEWMFFLVIGLVLSLLVQTYA